MSSVSDPATAGQPTDPSIPHRVTKLDLSHLAYTHDGRLLVSLEDADERDLTGRKVISFMVLTDQEAYKARESVEDAAYFAAARIVGRLPKLTGKGGVE